MKRRHVQTWLCAFGVVVFAPPAAAGSCYVNLRGSVPQLIMDDLSERFPEISQKTQKGLTVNLVTQSHLASSSANNELMVRCRIYADLWNEDFIVNRTSILSSAFSPPQKFKSLREALRVCQQVSLPLEVKGIEGLEVVTVLNPISDEQIEKTRKWLAERGIAANAGPMLGRAVGALLDLNDQKAIRRFCPAQ